MSYSCKNCGAHYNGMHFCMFLYHTRSAPPIGWEWLLGGAVLRSTNHFGRIEFERDSYGGMWRSYYGNTWVGRYASPRGAAQQVDLFAMRISDNSEPSNPYSDLPL